MIEIYWNEVFGRYKAENGKFEIPGFPAPLMSPHFGVTNLIGKKGVGKQYWLCEFEATHNQSSSIARERLKDIGHEFWQYQKQNNPGPIPFIEKLIPFLNNLEIEHYHLFMKDDVGLTASLIAGEARDCVFLFNVSVREELKGNGLARRLINETRNCFPHKKCFYWTVHKGFYLDSSVSSYCVVDDK